MTRLLRFAALYLPAALLVGFALPGILEVDPAIGLAVAVWFTGWFVWFGGYYIRRLMRERWG